MRKLFLLIMLTLSACVNGDGDQNAGPLQAATRRNISNLDAGPEVVDANYPRADVTYASYDSYFGLQIEYFASTGASYLWHERGGLPLKGQWAIREFGGRKTICFKYPSDVMERENIGAGRNWQCRNLKDVQRRIISYTPGDPFNLSLARPTLPGLSKCTLPAPMRMMARNVPCRKS